jgi:hypothetical protein
MLPLAYPLEATASVESALTKIADQTDAGQVGPLASRQRLRATLHAIRASSLRAKVVKFLYRRAGCLRTSRTCKLFSKLSFR